MRNGRRWNYAHCGQTFFGLFAKSDYVDFSVLRELY
jgi:hypothetical protein